DLRRGVRDARDVRLLARTPRRLRTLGRVGAGHDDARHALAIALAERLLADATVFEDVVQQRGDDLIFVAAVAAHEARHRERVHDVRGAIALAPLTVVERGGIAQGGLEPRPIHDGLLHAPGVARKRAARHASSGRDEVYGPVGAVGRHGRA